MAFNVSERVTVSRRRFWKRKRTWKCILRRFEYLWLRSWPQDPRGVHFPPTPSFPGSRPSSDVFRSPPSVLAFHVIGDSAAKVTFRTLQRRKKATKVTMKNYQLNPSLCLRKKICSGANASFWEKKSTVIQDRIQYIYDYRLMIVAIKVVRIMNKLPLGVFKWHIWMSTCSDVIVRSLRD